MDRAVVARLAPLVILAAVAVSVVSSDTAARSPAVLDGAANHEAVAVRQARLTGRPVPIPAMTTETAEFVALPSGDVQATISAGAVRVRRGDGWVPVDLTLRETTDGAVAPIAHSNDLRISGARPEGLHELAAVGAGDARVAMMWTGQLPKPVLNGARATFPEALPGVDLVVEATRIGFAQSLVVKDRAAADRVAAIRLSLTGPGVASHRHDPAAGVTLLDGFGRTLVTVPAPAMWDARTTPAGTPADMTAIEMSTAAVAGGVELTLRPDLSWLRHPVRKFPVTVDPTVNPLSTTFDTYVRETVTANQSGVGDLQIGSLATTPPTITRSFLTWNTSVLVGKQINSATVKFWNFWSHTCTPQGWEIWTTGAASTGTRWTNQPTWLQKEATSTQTNGSTACADAWSSVDGKSFFQRAASANAPQAHMGVRAADETVAAGFKQFRSRDWTENTSHVPQAVVTYNSWPTVTARATVPATTCVTGTGRPAVNTLAPQLKATVSDGDGTAMSVTFEWWAVGGSSALGSTTVSGVASGGTATVTVPAGAFADGGRYAWRVQASDGVSGSATWSSFCEMTTYVLAPPVEGCNAGVDSDYNGDGARDLAIADPEAAVGGHEEAGLVRVMYGGTGTVQTLTEDNARVLSSSEAGDRFGHALATYDVNRDGCSDLVVGAPYEDLNGLADVGSAYVLLGAPDGLATGPESLTWHQDRGAVADTLEAGDWFGFSVAAGHTTTGEGYLIIGAPGEDLPNAVDAGLVHYIRGTVNLGIDQAVTGSTDSNEADDRFGYSVSGSPYHVAAGRPGETVGTAAFAGAATVYTHALASGNLKLVKDQIGGLGQANAHFGKSVSMAAYRPSGAPAGQPDSFLVVGAPGEDVGGIADAGKVHRYHVTSTGLTGVEGIVHGGQGLSGSAEDGDYFGEKVLVVNTRPDEVATPQTLLVAVAAPGQDLAGASDAGNVSVFGAAATTVPGSAVVQRSAAGLPGSPTAQELIGLAMGGSAEHLYVASPYGDPAVYALSWSDLAAGTVSPAQIWRPGDGGVPAGETAFGAAIG